MMGSNLTADLKFLRMDPAQTERHQVFLCPPNANKPRITCKYDTVSVLVHNMRHLNTSLDRQGFTVKDLPCSMTTEQFLDIETVKEIYEPLLRNMLLDLTKADRVEFFSHTCREANPQFPARSGDIYPRKPPTNVTHIGTTTFSLISQCLLIVTDLTNEQAEKSGIELLEKLDIEPSVYNRKQVVKYVYSRLLNLKYGLTAYTASGNFLPMKMGIQ
jgi:hypothetical protein